MPVPIPKRYSEAVKEQGNLIGIAGTVALAFAFINPLPLLAGVVLEAVYLIFVPDSKWYTKRLAKRYDEEIRKRRQEMKERILPTLSARMRDRYGRLEIMHKQICDQAGEGQKWFAETPRKFDYLLDKFLEFANKQAGFIQYLVSVHEEVCGARPVPQKQDFNPSRTAMGRVAPGGKNAPPPIPMTGMLTLLDPDDPSVLRAIQDIEAKYAQDTASLQEMIGKEQDENTKAVLEKREEILKRRAEFMEKLSKTLVNLTHQLQLLEDTFGLINDEMRARSPEQILADIEDVVSQTDSMTRVLEELAPYEQMVSSIDRNRIAS